MCAQSTYALDPVEDSVSEKRSVVIGKSEPRDVFMNQGRPGSGWQPDSSETTEPKVEYPDPNTVLYRSMMLPGWGQVTNGQFWKVPIIYGLFAGVTLYNLDLTRKYKGFRAAYYNETRGEETDYRFGPTPDFVPDGITEEQMRRTRDQLHNQRDMSYLFFVLAYGLNVLDAYVYAHMRSFDVSDDLSARATVSPVVSPEGAAMVKLRVGIFSKE
ncbi:MAG: DUF5683 domain-containing protein [Balneolaceae bacterium]